MRYQYLRNNKLFDFVRQTKKNLFIKTTKFNPDAVHARRSIYDGKEIIFALDLHGPAQFMSKYLLGYKRDISMKTEYEINQCDEAIMERV